MRPVLLALAVLTLAWPVRAVVDVVSPGRFVVEIDGFDLEIPYDSTHPLDVPDPRIERVIIVIHGSSRNSDDHLARVEAAADSLAGESERTLILAPQFLEEGDIDFWGLPPTLLFWSSGWRQGNKSRDTVTNPRPARISSYAVIDAMLDAVMDPALYPNVARVVLAGHSAGGQFVNRFASGSPSEEIHAGVSFRYVVSNPSSYVYFTPARRVEGWPGRFAVPSAEEIARCPDYDQYKYGVGDLNAYMSEADSSRLLQRYGSREVWYVMGELVTGSAGLDVRCEAMLQGAFRLDRAILYFAYIREVFGPAVSDLHRLRVVPGVGHSSADIYASAIGQDALFGPTEGDDDDRDDVSDSRDNCLLVANPDQTDTDHDGYGNRCDADYTNDGTVGIADFNVLRTQFGLADSSPLFDPAVDMNGDGAIGIPEFNLVRGSFGGAPGPSGLECAGTVPCP